VIVGSGATLLATLADAAPTATPLKALLKRLASAIGPAILNGR